MVKTKTKTAENRRGSKSAGVPCYVPEPWFGKGCPHLIAKWETEYREEEPVLMYCNHKDNRARDCEGNCYRATCPLKQAHNDHV
jgi:hypothetical protein